jgi:2-dehydropantoate 2-reductase
MPPVDSQARITIVGGGAMGALFAALLARAGVSTSILDAAETVVETINRDGVAVDEPGGGFAAKVTAATEPEALQPADAVFFFVKCYQTRGAIELAAPLLDGDATVVSLQNGWGNAPLLADAVDADRLVIGVTYLSSTTTAPGRVSCKLGGRTIVGPYGSGDDTRARSVARLLQGAGVEVDVAVPVETEIWRKLVLNAATLPTSAISRLAAGRMYVHEDMRRLVDAAAREAVAVARASGYELDEQECLEVIHTVLRDAGDVKSSMLQDVERGTRTEIDVVTGAVVRAAEAAKIDVPVNRALYSLINGYESAVLAT